VVNQLPEDVQNQIDCVRVGERTPRCSQGRVPAALIYSSEAVSPRVLVFSREYVDKCEGPREVEHLHREVAVAETPVGEAAE